MELMKKSQFRQLVSQNDRGPVLSLYLSRTHSQNKEQVLQRFVKLFARAKAMLEKHFPDKVPQLLTPFQSLHQKLQEIPPNQGLAAYSSLHFSGYATGIEGNEDIAVVANSFHIKPVLDRVQAWKRFYIVCLAENRIELHSANADEASLQSAFEITHTNLSGKARQKEILKFYKSVERDIKNFLRFSRAPIVLCGASELTSLFHSVTKNRNIEAKSLTSSSKDTLQDTISKASDIVEASYAMQLQRALNDFRIQSIKRRVAIGVHEVAKAVVRGRVRTLFVSKELNLPGHLCRNTGDVTFSEDASTSGLVDDVLDDLAELVISKGGNAFAIREIDMPVGSVVAATLK